MYIFSANSVRSCEGQPAYSYSFYRGLEAKKKLYAKIQVYYMEVF